MPFYRIDIGDGRTTWAHLNFGRKAGPSLCVAPRLERDHPIDNDGGRCCRIATKLCDAPAGRDLGGTRLTCSMPICDEHAAHVVGKDVDYCPRHAHLAPAPLPLEEVRSHE